MSDIFSLINQVNQLQQLSTHNALAALEQLTPIIKAYPTFNGAQQLHFNLYQQIAAPQQQINVLKNWLTAQPQQLTAVFDLAKVQYKELLFSDAIQSLKQLCQLYPEHHDAWLLLSKSYRAINDIEQAQYSHHQFELIAAFNQQLIQAEQAFNRGDFNTADKVARQLLQQVKNEPRVLRLLAQLAQHFGYDDVAVQLRGQVCQIKPHINQYQVEFALTLFAVKQYQSALDAINQVLDHDIYHLEAYGIKAMCLVKLARYQDAVDVYQDLCLCHPNPAQVQLRLGNVYKIMGQPDKAVAAFLEAITLNPLQGEAYWDLANLKTYRFSAIQISELTKLLTIKTLTDESRILMHFALGKAYEDQHDYAQSFEHYQTANQLKFKTLTHYKSPNAISQTTFFTAEYFKQTALLGHTSQAPIFIVGMPRSGSTLMEQMLSNHSQIDATMELTEIVSIARKLAMQAQQAHTAYPAILGRLTAKQIGALAEQYLNFVQPLRQGAAYFIDKLPNNFHHLGLIKTLFPNAKIIDVRRHPMASGWSLFKHYFAEGHDFSYDLTQIGLYHNHYVSLMDHWHSVLPNQILTIYYEDLVNDLPTTLATVFNYLELELEPACIAFHTNNRAVATASSEQVRQPLYQSALHHWQGFDPYLTPLKQVVTPNLIG